MWSKDQDWTCDQGPRRILDYAVVSVELRPLLKAISVLRAVPWKPHVGLHVVLHQKPAAVSILRALPALGPEAKGKDVKGPAPCDTDWDTAAAHVQDLYTPTPDGSYDMCASEALKSSSSLWKPLLLLHGWTLA